MTANDGRWLLHQVLMIAWVRPTSYDLVYNADTSTIMNKEHAYEFGLMDNSGAIISAFSPCWAWFGTRLVPMHEWTHIATGYDGASQVHFVNAEIVESRACGAGGRLRRGPSVAIIMPPSFPFIWRIPIRVINRRNG